MWSPSCSVGEVEQKERTSCLCVLLPKWGGGDFGLSILAAGAFAELPEQFVLLCGRRETNSSLVINPCKLFSMFTLIQCELGPDNMLLFNPF